MDNSANGTDKRNWRERLGIGTKPIPKLSDDMKPEQPAETPATPVKLSPEPGAAKFAPRPQAVARPAPMAPRAAVRPTPAAPSAPPSVTSAKPATPPQPAPPPPARPSQPSVSPEGLANRLKAQREAAEKLAEQRIQMARQRAEAARQENTAATNGQPKPKFVFVDEEARSQPAAAVPASSAASPRPEPASTAASTLPPSLVRTSPPRPSLGAAASPQLRVPGYQGQSPVPPSSAPYVPPRQPQFQQPYRPPVDPVTGYAPPPGGQRSYAPPLAPASAQRPSAPPPLPPAGGYSEDEFDYAASSRPQARNGRPGLAVPPRPATAYADDDIFEHPVRPSRRATASEYNQAYRETDHVFDEEARRSSSIWLWLSLGLAAIAIAGVMTWLYFSKVNSTAGLPAAAKAPVEQAPVVTPPAQPTKEVSAPAQPEQPAANAQQQVAPVTTKKLIHDRIVGDKEVLGDVNMVPTEVVPVTPEAGTQSTAPQPATGQSQPAPASAQPAPSAAPPPDTQEQGTGDSAPLPLPPPPGSNGQQGQMETPPATAPQTSQTANVTPAANESQAANLPAPANANTNPAIGKTADGSVAVDDVVPTPSEQLAQIAAGKDATAPAGSAPAADAQAPQAQTTTAAPATASSAADPVASASNDAITESESSDAGQPATSPAQVGESKAVKTPATKPKSRTHTASAPSKPKSASPVVLVAPNDAASTQQTASSDGIYGALPSDSTSPAAAGQAQPKKRTLFDLLKQEQGTSTQADAPAPRATAPRETSVASIQPQPAPVIPQPPAPSDAAGGGYVVQLASFPSRNEATAEFSRVRAAHSQIVSGLSPVVSEANVGGSVRYRLGLGPVSSRAAASQLCSRLIAQGERDCSITRQ